MKKKMRNWLTGGIAMILLIALTGCSSIPAPTGATPVESGTAVTVPTVETTAAQEGTAMEEAVYRKITPKEAKEMMDGGGVLILDVRTTEEFAAGHIAEAVLLPDYDIAAQAETVLTDKAATILVYCRTGRRSEGAAKKLVELGYTGIYDFGGIVEWPYEVVR